MEKSTKTNIQETEAELVEKAQQAISSCNWVVGECAAKWTQKYAKGRTDADFGAMVGMSTDQVYQRRRVWETFGDVYEEYTGLKWSHFYVCLTWNDAPECLQWAVENNATVAEMRAWRRLQHGEDLTVAADTELLDEEAAELVTFVPSDPTLVREPAGAGGDQGRRGSGSAQESRDTDRTTVAAVAHEKDAAGSDYSPFKQGASSPAPKEESSQTVVAKKPQLSAEQIIGGMTKALERCNKALTPELTSQFKMLPDKVRKRFIKAVGELSSKAAGLM